MYRFLQFVARFTMSINWRTENGLWWLCSGCCCYMLHVCRLLNSEQSTKCWIQNLHITCDGCSVCVCNSFVSRIQWRDKNTSSIQHTDYYYLVFFFFAHSFVTHSTLIRSSMRYYYFFPSFLLLLLRLVRGNSCHFIPHVPSSLQPCTII